MSANGKNPSPDYTNLLIIIAVFLTAVFLALRIRPALAVGLLVLGIVAGIGYLGYQYWLARKEKQARPDENSFGARVSQRLAECVASEERFRAESETIRNSIATLRDDIDRSTGSAGDDERERAQVIIKELEAEFNLRHAKASFFADCAAKLRQLLDRLRLHESIAARKRELDELRKTNFDDEASLEETRYHLEQDSIQLDTIAELTKDISVSFKAEQAEELRAKLEKLRTSL